MILNLTQHIATPEQVQAGVVDLEGKVREEVINLLNFAVLPTGEEVEKVAREIASLTAKYQNDWDGSGVWEAMIGGAPFLMHHLVVALQDQGITPIFAFSQRESVEVTKEDGSVHKTAIFKHKGFVGV